MFENLTNALILKNLQKIWKMLQNIIRITISIERTKKNRLINVKWNRIRNKILNVLNDIQNHTLKITQRIIFSNFKMLSRHVIDRHFHEIFTFFHRNKIDRNIHCNIKFLQRKMFLQVKIYFFRNVFFSILRVQFSIFCLRKIRNFSQTMSVTMRLYRFFTNSTTITQITNMTRNKHNQSMKISNTKFLNTQISMILRSFFTRKLHSSNNSMTKNTFVIIWFHYFAICVKKIMSTTMIVFVWIITCSIFMMLTSNQIKQ